MCNHVFDLATSKEFPGHPELAGAAGGVFPLTLLRLLPAAGA